MAVGEIPDIPKDIKVVSVAQAAESLNVSKMTIYRWANSTPPIIASREIAGLLCIPKKEIERLKKARAPADTTEAHSN